MSDMYNEKNGKIRCGFRCEYPDTQEFAGHTFRHLAGGLYKAEEEFELTAKEARQILHEYRQIRLLVRKKDGQRGVYSDYYNWRQKSSYCTLEVGHYPVYRVLYAYARGYEDPNLDDYLNYPINRASALKDSRMSADLKKIMECYRRYSVLDILCGYVFSELGYYKRMRQPELRTAFEWKWPEEGIPGFIYYGMKEDKETFNTNGPVICKEIEEGIYRFVEYHDIGKYFSYTAKDKCFIPQEEGITVDDIAYLHSGYMDGGGWYFPEKNVAEYFAIGKEHFDQLRKYGSDFMYFKQDDK